MPEIPINPSLTGEHSTSARFSFANSAYARQVHLEDYMVGRFPQRTRLIRYQSGANRTLRGQLQASGLILGRQVESESDVYVVPKSARPLTYEATMKREGSFSYTDEQLMHDLGSLLGKTAALETADGGSWNMIALEDPQTLGGLVAIVDFTLPDERNLFLLPGVEEVIVPFPKDTLPDPAQFYTDQLAHVFGGNPEALSVYFRMGFNEQLAGVQDETA